MSERRIRPMERPLNNGETASPDPAERVDEDVVVEREPVRVAEPVNVIERHTTVAPFKDRLRWGPIIGGMVTTIALMIFLTLIGVAIGLAIFEPTSDPTNVTTSAAIWSAISGILAFFLGGWVTGKTAAVENDDNALINGFMVAATALFVIVFLGGLGLANLFGIIGSSLGDIAQVVTNNRGAVPTDISVSPPDANTLFERAENSVWYTLAGLALGFAAATLGGWAGHASRHGHDLHAEEPAHAD